MGNASDEMDVDPVVIEHIPASNNPVNLRTDSTATNPEAVPVDEVVMAERPTCPWTIGDQRSFTKFIEDLRAILADHQDHHEDICDGHADSNISSSRKHPLLPKPRSEQPERWIHIKLQMEGEDEKKGPSATLLMRDDNVDVIGFINQSGFCYDFGDLRSTRQMLPPEYKSELLGWGDSYKSILSAKNAEGVADKMKKSTKLGKAFATDAVCMLSCYPDKVAGIKMSARIAVVGLMFMVCESARLNPVEEAITSAWDTGMEFTKQLMTDHVCKYVESSRRLRQWKRGNYVEPWPDSELRDIYLVLNGHAELLYTIADEISFISFMTDLRRKLAEHPDSEDILGGHDDPNLSETGRHPVLAKQRADEQPARWIHVTLQAGVGEERSWTTLFIRDDNLYVCGFMNQQGLCYQLHDGNQDASTNMLLPITNGCHPRLPGWGVSYVSMLGAQNKDHAVHKLEKANLGLDFAKNAVRVLSSHPNPVEGVDLSPKVALAGLIVIICESARMNRPHDSIAREWTTGKGFAKKLMKNYVWEYGNMSRTLMAWKTRKYTSNVSEKNWQPHPIMELQTIHLVLNTQTGDQAKKEEKNKNQSGKPGNVNNDGDSVNKPGNTGSGRGPPGQSRGGGHSTNGCGGPPSQSGGGHERKRGCNFESNGGPQIQHKKACNIRIGGSSASKSSEEARDADSNGRRDSKSEEARDADGGCGPVSQPNEAGDGTDSSGSSSSSQPGEAGNAGGVGGGSSSSSGSTSQPGKSGDSSTSPSRGNSGSQNRDGELDVPCQGQGRPRVELMAIHADLQVIGTEIIVLDGKRGQIIYRMDKQQREEELLLTGPYKGISAYGCFAIKIVIPKVGLIKWEWDCYDPEYAEEVDKTPVPRTISSSGPGRNVKVTYAVMSNAMEATVLVKLQLKDGQSPGGIWGKITALINGFNVPSVLFSCKEEMGLCSSYRKNNSWFLLQLARNVVAVPCGRVLHIVMDLQIETSDNQGVKLCLKANLEFANGTPSQRHKDKDGNEVEVKINWSPENGMATTQPSDEDFGDAPPRLSRHSTEVEKMPWHLPDVVYTIRDEMSYNGFIMTLRRILANHEHPEDIMGRHYDPNLSSTQEHPLLAKPGARQPSRWVHVKIQVEGEEMSTTTLVIRDDNLYLKGFMNQNEEWYEVTDRDENSALMLPAKYRARKLPWGVSCRSIVGGLGVKRLNKNFAIDAVRRLSCYPDKEYDESGNRVALAGMVFMACEAARMIPQQEMVVSGWRSNEIQPIDSDYNFLLFSRKWNWCRMSRELLQWRSNGYMEWPKDTASGSDRIITSEYNALGVIKDVKLVLNAPEYLCKGPEPQASLYGRPRVELLAVSADSCVLGTTITVFDGKRGQIIYRHKDGQQEVGSRVVDLVLIGPYKPICAYGNFAIQVDIPVVTTGTGSEDEYSSSNNSDSDGVNIYWEWDGNNPEYATEAKDIPKLVSRSINSSAYPGRNIKVTYAVMNNALEAKLQVRLEIPDLSSDANVYGTVSARAECFQVGSVLFSRGERGAQAVCFHNGHCFLPLARSFVAVPVGWTLHIVVDLTVVDFTCQRPRQFRGTLSFSKGCSKQRLPGENGSMEVDITWYPQPPETGEYDTNVSLTSFDADLEEGTDEADIGSFNIYVQSILGVHNKFDARHEWSSDKLEPKKRVVIKTPSILGWVISPIIISKLVNKGFSYLDNVTGSLANNLQNLAKNVQFLNLALETAQASPAVKTNPAVKNLEPWVKELKSAFYIAEDVMDAIDYHHLKCKALFRSQPVNKTKQKATRKKDFNVPNELKKELSQTIKWIQDLIDKGQKLLPLLHLTTSGENIKSSPKLTMGLVPRSFQTTSIPPTVFGRHEDTKKIRSMLHDTAADHSVIGIHGIAGSGKSTLAQNVYDCEKKSDGLYFELFMWIHITKNFSVHTVYNEMLEIASGQKMDRLSNLDMLQSELNKRLKGKRLLLVLDDVWYPESVDEQNDLFKLLSPLKEADKGSRVLVTTRTADAAKLLGAQNPIPISDMTEEDFFKMFMHYALGNSMFSEQDIGKFELVGREISLQLLKSPLAGRTVAGQLRLRTSRAEDIGFWIDIMNRDRDLLNDTMGALWWSYHQLEEHVRQCFAYCSMFPRRYELTRDELVEMWMAQGFVDTSKNSDMEVTANVYFEVLLSASFIQLKREFDGVQYYTVNDLLHNLAGSVAGSDCFTIEKDMEDHQIPQDVRHLFIDSNNLEKFMEQIVKLDTLRTLVMSSSATKITAKNFKSMIKHLKKLRFVRVWLEEFGANVIPECIGELKHLRYLGLIGFSSDSRRIDLPPAFTKLYHLQELFVPLAFPLRCLDSSHMADLENLLRIKAYSVSIPDIGRMPWLQTLGGFTVKKEKGYEITQLEKLNNIRGELRIKGLGNIQSKEDAGQANLSNKLRVSSLAFDWENNNNEETGSSSTKKQKTDGYHQQVVTKEPEEILEALHPPALLEKLFIENYSGSTFPSWLSGEVGKLKYLQSLSFYNCHGLGSEFKFSKPLDELHRLDINTCSWNTLPENIDQMTSLKELIIRSCRNIKSLPRLPSSLKKLIITVCRNIKTLPELPPSLEELECEQYLVDSYPDSKVTARIENIFIV